MTVRIGEMSKSAGAPLGGSSSRPLGSWSLHRDTALSFISVGPFGKLFKILLVYFTRRAPTHNIS